MEKGQSLPTNCLLPVHGIGRLVWYVVVAAPAVVDAKLTVTVNATNVVVIWVRATHVRRFRHVSQERFYSD